MNPTSSDLSVPIQPPFDIDVVITYVNMMDPYFKQSITSYMDWETMDYSRYYDNNELQFCIRSIDKYMKFVRHIYLVLADYHQVPPYINTQSVRIIRHGQIIPSCFLPTFNSRVIENFIHHIPHLSEHFLYFNDDMILLRPQHWYHFFTPSGTLILSSCLKVQTRTVSNVGIKDYWNKDKNQLRKTINYGLPYSYDTYIQQNMHLLDLLMKEESGRSVVQHIPQPFRVSHLHRMDQFLSKYQVSDSMSLLTFSNQFKWRHHYQIAKVMLFHKYYQLYYLQGIQRTFPVYEIFLKSDQLETKQIQNLLFSDASFLSIYVFLFTINDTYLQNVHVLHQTLLSLFPEKSRYELG